MRDRCVPVAVLHIWLQVTVLNTVSWRKTCRVHGTRTGVAVFHGYMANLRVITTLAGRAKQFCWTG